MTCQSQTMLQCVGERVEIEMRRMDSATLTGLEKFLKEQSYLGFNWLQ